MRSAQRAVLAMGGLHSGLAALLVSAPGRLRALMRSVARLGFGRQAALAAARRAFPSRAATPMYRMLSLFAGSLFIGIGVALLQQARLGLTPYDVLVSGLMPRIGLSFGQTVWLISAVLFAAAAVLGQFPSRWGIAYVFANGVAIDSVAGFINAPESLAARWLFVGLSLVALCAGISAVVHSGSTGGAFELLMKAGEVRGRDRKAVRTGLEVGILTLGLALGGTFGPATVVIAVGIGPVLGAMSLALADHQRGRNVRRLDAHVAQPAYGTTPESRHPSAPARR